jgi:serine/threonine-protein kinase
VLLSDFGLARVLGEQSLTVDTNTIVGTLFYMSPEQVNAERVRINERSDIYSLGASLYQTIVGRVPFEAENVLGLQVKITCDDPVPIRVHQPGISRDIETIVMKCLEKDPTRRYRSALAVAEDIERYLRGELIAARPAGFLSRAWRKLRLHSRLAASALGAMVATAALVFLLVLLPRIRERKKDRETLESALRE